jgi:hypothetical protein
MSRLEDSVPATSRRKIDDVDLNSEQSCREGSAGSKGRALDWAERWPFILIKRFATERFKRPRSSLASRRSPASCCGLVVGADISTS